ncbi:MAG: restriction endonuclease [Actinomycetota bacterium]
MTGVFVVRAEFGTYTRHFIEGGYAGIGWMGKTDLSAVQTREELYPLYRTEHPDVTSNYVIGNHVGQIARFLFDIKPGDYVITPEDTEWLRYGVVGPDPPYMFVDPGDGCPFAHRRPVAWIAERLRRGAMSVPLQNALRALLTVFAVSQSDEFLVAIGRPDLAQAPAERPYDPHRVVLEQVLQLDDTEFEVLIAHLLTALGFEGSERTGGVGDGGVDAIGELNIANLAKVKVYVQAKRYKLDNKISAAKVRELRQAIPFGGQGAFITTADFQRAASDVALEPGFPRIGLINGRQLVDLLVEHWSDIPSEFRERLGLRPGLVRA